MKKGKLIKNDSFLRALRGEALPHPPIWLMRQAGRYLPEYRQARAEAGSFLDLCRHTELATEVTLQPLRRFPLDAAILFSDILTVPDAMGLGLYFVEGEGPKFKSPVRNENDVKQLRIPDPVVELRYVMDAVSSISKALDGSVPLIGFSGSPFTLACYMVQGGSSPDFFEIKRMLYRQPSLLHQLLDINARAVVDYLNAQIEAGADVVQIFDTWGGILTAEQYREFSLLYIEQILSGIIKEHEGRKIPVILFTKGGGQWVSEMAKTGVDAIGLDWQTDPQTVRRNIATAAKEDERIQADITLQGNLDPLSLLGTEETLTTEVNRVLKSFVSTDGLSRGHIFNLGHGIDRRTPPEAVSKLCQIVKGE